MSNHLLDAEQQKSKNLEDLNQNARDINITSSFRSKLLHDFIELKALIRLAAPLTATYIAFGLLQMTNLFFVGHLGKKEYLAGAALGSTYCNVFGFAIGSGLLTASDTLSSQAFGAGNFKRVGIILQRSILISGLVAIPIICLFWFADKILLMLKQDPDIVTIAGVFTRWMIPGVPMSFTFEALKRYLQAQGLVIPILWVSLVVCLFNALITYVMMYIFGLGFLGAPISLSITYTVMMCSGILCIYWLTDWRKTWGGWSRDSLRGWTEFFALGVPGVLMVCAEWWGYEIHTILAGWIDTVSLAAQTVVLTSISILYMLPLGFSIGVTTRVGNELGAGNGKTAARAAKVAITNKWGFVFSDDLLVTELVANTLPIICLFLFADGGQGVASGVLRGSGKQRLGAMFNLIGYYALSIPIGSFLAFYVKIGIRGLWIGLLCGALFCFSSFIIVLLRLDWQHEAEVARKRSEAETKTTTSSDNTHTTKTEEIELVPATNNSKYNEDTNKTSHNFINTPLLPQETDHDHSSSQSTSLLSSENSQLQEQ